ncbi:hypothetical protein MJO55_10890 [Mycolicibacterium rufum]|uniref:DUF1622 domain-containing protein n=1 Tax=Mycolicibacterium rufum TaxID=318424 RepID=A0A9X3BEN7_9MYCO|nr:hypothetical protein [Mycolicibacterium rufum]KGI67880.1 hypothetical protein EU78_10960 [Mycolicibacterium rufum]MCV7069609.1 hypothetical protein [Mycolicibacterium rufum]ULP38867.1 hypothetical protein MJO55_10890 [Mycolicibacterium rufum]
MSVIVNASWCLAIAGIVLGVAALLVFRQPLPALRVMIELFTAAGLLRLSVDLSWAAILGVVALIAVRRVVTRSLTVDLRPVR